MSTSSSPPKSPVLPPETLHSILSSIELLSAMWSGENELLLSPNDESSIKNIAEYLQLELQTLGDETSLRVKENLAEEVCLGLRVRGDPSLPENGIWVNVGFRLRGREGGCVRMWTSGVDAPIWLGREKVEEVNGLLERSLEEGEEGEDMVGMILNAIESVSEVLLTINPTPITTTIDCSPPIGSDSKEETVLRIWYYLPSLSTKSKRLDIVHLALTHTPPLTGFLLAGKPGLIILEHPSSPTASSNLSAFWSTIKTQSWSDIPSSHKKISEKLIQQDVRKAFDGFHDITDWPEVERGADRGRKSDLSKVVVWLDGRGVDGRKCLEKVLGVGGWET